MPIEYYSVEGYEEFLKTVKEFQRKNKPLYILFYGSLNSDGKSWCPDCINETAEVIRSIANVVHTLHMKLAEPVIKEFLNSIEETKDFVYLHVGVGDRPTWKDPKSKFRTDPKLRLKSVPTIIKWGESKKLEDNECSNKDMLNMLFED